MRTLIAIPVFNEEKYVADVLRRILRHGHDVLVIDDGSTDRTPEILAGISGIHVITHFENRGYGQSLIDAFHYADRENYDWIVTIDCDEQHEPACIPSFIKRAAQDDADIVSGSRYLRELPGNSDAPSDRRNINAEITQLLNAELGFSLTDAFCGFKAYRVEALSRLSLTIPGYAFPLQLWVQAAWHGFRIVELPVKRVYIDPNRHFGGMLDDPAVRYQHYLDVFNDERARMARAEACAHPCCGASNNE